MPLTKHIEAVREMRKELARLNDADKDFVYARGCSKSENVADLLKEAEAHGCILAYKTDDEGRVIVTAIVPFLVDGWKQHGGAQ